MTSHSKRKFGEAREDGYRFVSIMLRIGEALKLLKNIYKMVKNRKKEFMILLVD